MMAGIFPAKQVRLVDDVTLWKPVDGGNSERRHDNHAGITPAVKLVDELGG